MVETEERKMKEREQAVKAQEEKDRKAGKVHPKKTEKNGKGNGPKKEENDDEKK